MHPQITTNASATAHAMIYPMMKFLNWLVVGLFPTVNVLFCGEVEAQDINYPAVESYIENHPESQMQIWYVES